MTLSISADDIRISPGGSRRIDLDIYGVEERDLANALSIKDFLASVDEADVLNAIGIQAAKDHFDLTETEEQ